MKDTLEIHPDVARVHVAIPCDLVTDRRAFPAELYDLSYGGACLTAPGLPEFLPNGLQWIEATGLGRIDVIFRWRQGARIGVSFRSEYEVKPVLDAFFAERGIALGPAKATA